MARVILAELADSDTAQIINDLAEKAGPSVSARYNARFDEVYSRLEVFPEFGTPRPKLGEQARICLVLPYIIIYEYAKSQDVVTVLRILHGKREITRRLLQSRA